MSKQIKLFIVEGEDKYHRLIKRLTELFLTGKYSSKVITIPASQNIYMLYEKLSKDDFDTDVIELLRESNEEVSNQLEGVCRQNVSEIYMFFDYDVQQDNLNRAYGETPIEETNKVVETMLSVFNNETENGKMYLSYPMVEAAYDFRDGMCETITKCFINLPDLDLYKGAVGLDNPNIGSHFDKLEIWDMIINVFYLRLKCLLEKEDLSFDDYRAWITPQKIYREQRKVVDQKNSVFVLCGFPEFLLDYFKRDFWNSRIKLHKYNYQNCPKNTN